MKRLLVILCLLTLSITTSADVPKPTYFKPDQLPHAVLRDTIGVLRMYIGEIDPEFIKTTVPTYKRRSSGKFSPDKPITIGSIFPIRNFEEDIGMRIPIVDRDRDYIKIVSDARNNSRIWIRLPEVAQLGFATTAHPFWLTGTAYSKQDTEGEPVDIFLLNENGKRKLYQSPSLDAWAKEISADSKLFNEQLPMIIKQRNGFAQIGVYRNSDGKLVSIGWIKLRDSKGRMTVWPQYAPDCGC